MNIIFFGTSQFAVPALEALSVADYKPVLVVTLPDRPQGRRLEILPSPVKVAAQKLSIEILQPEKVSDPEFLKKISETTWAFGIVAAYGKLIPQAVLDIPEKGFLNIHPSLLPELRGPSPIQYAILEGKKKTGVSVMLLDSLMDHGPILIQEEEKIKLDDTADVLESRLAEKGAKALVKALPLWIDGNMQAIAQDESKATFSKKIEKEDGRIAWSEPAEIIARKVRAYAPWPGTFSFADIHGAHVRLKILEAESTEENHSEMRESGFVINSEKGMMVVTGKGLLRIQKIQPEGKNPMTGSEFLRGHRDVIGKILR